MSLLEPRCMVCGGRLSRLAIFEEDARYSEVCSEECYETYIECDEYESIHDKEIE